MPRAKATKKSKKVKDRKKVVTPKLTAIKDKMTKTQIMAYISAESELSKKEVAAVFESLSRLMHRHLKKGGAGEFTLPGLLKCLVKKKPARKAKKGINPFTGEPTVFKAKPASKVVKVRPLRRLKEMVE